jgi:hypothetical protein
VPANDETLRRLCAAIEDLAAIDAAELLKQARADARGRVLSVLTEAMAQSMLEQIHERARLPADPPAAAAIPATDPVPDTEAVPATTVPVDPGRPLPESPAPGPTSSSQALAWYVYGVIASPTDVGGAEMPVTIDPDHPLEILREGPLAAVCSEVPVDEFDDTQLRANLADMGWIERVARAHEAVLEWTRERGTVIPMRMCTVYRTDGGVREMLRSELESLEEALLSLEGKDEWGVKVFFEPATRRSQDDDRDSSAESGPDAGAMYMRRRQQELEEDERAAREIEEAAAHIHERLCELASDGLVSPPQRPEASGHPGQMVLNGVYLVSDAVVGEFHDTVRALQHELGHLGLTLVETGPWPAYNFVPGAIGAGW